MSQTCNGTGTSADSPDSENSLWLVNNFYSFFCFYNLLLQSISNAFCDFRLIDKKRIWSVFILYKDKKMLKWQSI